ncbi:thioredoxin [Streptomyces phage Beuffert]|nr:thioredoxin [Streptomyces phage Beuffert]
MSEVRKAQSLAELTEIINDNDSVVVDFSKSEGCVYCKRLTPHFEKAAAKSDVQFVEVDVLNVTEAIDAFGIQSVPTVLHFRKGEATATLLGRTSVKLLQEING